MAPRASLAAAVRTGLESDQVLANIESYNRQYEHGTVAQRQSGYERLVNPFYDLVTDFYEYGWGQSFHFAPRMAGESFNESLHRHERELAQRTGVAPGGRLLDVGCGVGGPMRTIAKATGARVTGLNNNAYQVGRGTQHNERAGLAEQCELVKGDFLAMPFDDNTFDGAYEIEATCHAPDKRSVYAEVLRVLKPGAVFAGYEWVTTDRYDPDNLEHRRLAHQVSAGNALPDLQGGDEVRRAMLEAGFEEVHCQDLAPTAHPDTPWYQSLVGEGMSVRGLARSTAGRAMTHAAVRTLEALRIAPRGSAGVSAMLNEGADALVAAGRLGIFTPSYLHVGRKPR